jgi:DNA invertase Pin-like site-specific DNA recombinase
MNSDGWLEDMTFDRIFIETFSNNFEKRPALNRMLDYIKPNAPYHVYVFEISHLARSMIDLYNIIDVIRKKGASITFIKEQITFESSQEKPAIKESVFGGDAIISEFQRQLFKRQR